MKRELVCGQASAIAILITFFAAGDAAASHPDFLYNYRFIPSHSTLEVTGGFAGLHQTFHAFGKFGLVTGFEEDTHPPSPHPVHRPFAEFVDVNSWLVPRSPLTFVWDTDQTLNLTGLDGTIRPDHPQQLFFHGVDGQGQPFKLIAVQRGRLLHLMGENDPGCCDFFHYKFDALAHLAPHADFNLDGIVDRGDVHLLAANIGMFSDATLEQGDADGDGDVDGDDFLTWQRQIGTATAISEFAGDSMADFALGAATVPEPAAVVLFAAGAAALAGWLNRARR